MSQFVAGKFDFQLSHIIADRTAIELSELTRQMHRVNADKNCHLMKCKRLKKLLTQEIARLSKPARRNTVCSVCQLAACLAYHFQRQPFDDERRQFIGSAKFIVEP